MSFSSKSGRQQAVVRQRRNTDEWEAGMRRAQADQARRERIIERSRQAWEEQVAQENLRQERLQRRNDAIRLKQAGGRRLPSRTPSPQRRYTGGTRVPPPLPKSRPIPPPPKHKPPPIPGQAGPVIEDEKKGEVRVVLEDDIPGHNFFSPEAIERNKAREGKFKRRREGKTIWTPTDKVLEQFADFINGQPELLPYDRDELNAYFDQLINPTKTIIGQFTFYFQGHDGVTPPPEVINVPFSNIDRLRDIRQMLTNFEDNDKGIAAGHGSDIGPVGGKPIHSVEFRGMMYDENIIGHGPSKIVGLWPFASTRPELDVDNYMTNTFQAPLAFEMWWTRYELEEKNRLGPFAFVEMTDVEQMKLYLAYLSKTNLANCYIHAMIQGIKEYYTRKMREQRQMFNAGALCRKDSKEPITKEELEEDERLAGVECDTTLASIDRLKLSYVNGANRSSHITLKALEILVAENLNFDIKISHLNTRYHVRDKQTVPSAAISPLEAMAKVDEITDEDLADADEAQQPDYIAIQPKKKENMYGQYVAVHLARSHRHMFLFQKTPFSKAYIDNYPQIERAFEAGLFQGIKGRSKLGDVIHDWKYNLTRWNKRGFEELLDEKAPELEEEVRIKKVKKLFECAIRKHICVKQTTRGGKPLCPINCSVARDNCHTCNLDCPLMPPGRTCPLRNNVARVNSLYLLAKLKQQGFMIPNTFLAKLEANPEHIAVKDLESERTSLDFMGIEQQAVDDKPTAIKKTKPWQLVVYADTETNVAIKGIKHMPLMMGLLVDDGEQIEPELICTSDYNARLQGQDEEENAEDLRLGEKWTKKLYHKMMKYIVDAADTHHKKMVATCPEYVKLLTKRNKGREKKGQKPLKSMVMVRLYFHFLKYDYHTICGEMTPNKIMQVKQTFYSVATMYKGLNITFVDSKKLIDIALADFGKSFGLAPDMCKKEAIWYEFYRHCYFGQRCSVPEYASHLKTKHDKAVFKENLKLKDAKGKSLFNVVGEDERATFNPWDYYKWYLKYDVMVLKAGMDEFNRKIKQVGNRLDMRIFGEAKYGEELNIHNFLTVSSLADYLMNIYGAYEGVYKVKGCLRHYISKAIWGGRNHVNPAYRGIVLEDIISKDAKSLYSSAQDRICKNPGYYDRKQESDTPLLGEEEKNDVTPENAEEEKKDDAPAYKGEYRVNVVGACVNRGKVPKRIEMTERAPGFSKGRAKPIENWEPWKYDNYVCRIRVLSVKKRQQMAMLCHRDREGIIRYSDTVFGEVCYCDRTQLEDWIRFQGITYEFIDGVYWDEGGNTRAGVICQELYTYRCEIKKNDEALSNVIKLILNSTYGKMIEKPHEEEVKPVLNTRGDQQPGENRDNFIKRYYNTLLKWQALNDKVTLFHVMKYDDTYNMAHLGVQVLSMSKRIMNEVFDLANSLGVKIYYTDTDSFFMHKYDEMRLEAAYMARFGRVLTGDQMGQFEADLEQKVVVNEGELNETKQKCKNVVGKFAIFNGKKTYCIRTEGVLVKDGVKDKEGVVISKEERTACVGDKLRAKGFTVASLEYKIKLEHERIFNDKYEVPDMTGLLETRKAEVEIAYQTLKEAHYGKAMAFYVRQNYERLQLEFAVPNTKAPFKTYANSHTVTLDSVMRSLGNPIHEPSEIEVLREEEEAVHDFTWPKEGDLYNPKENDWEEFCEDFSEACNDGFEEYDNE